MRKISRGIILCLFLLLFGVFGARGEIILVDDDGFVDFNNIQAGIDDSNDGDTVVVFPGMYTGPGNVDIDFYGKAITLISVAPEDPYVVAHTIIDCNGQGRGFYFHSGEEANSVVDGLSITNGAATNGGGICIENCSATISNCQISGGTANEGGGIYCVGGESVIIGCSLGDNTANNGGGIYISSSSGAMLSDCDITGNTADIEGGGIYCVGGKPRIVGCTIGSNASASGGGIFFQNGRAYVEDCTFIHNSNNGMSIINGGGTVVNCRFYSNRGEYGGGIYCNSNRDMLHVISSIFCGNYAAVDGGGIYAGNWYVQIQNCSIVSNRAGSTGGGYHNIGTGDVINSVFWGNIDNSGSGGSAQIGGLGDNVTFSCIGDGDPCDSNIPFGGSSRHNIDDDPGFVSDPNDGGDGWGDDPCTVVVNEGVNDDYGDLHLRGDSVCINAGEPGFVDYLSFNDIDGQPRIMGQIMDMGADEFYIAMLKTTRPLGTEVWVSGSRHEIRWESEVYDGLASVLFSSDRGDNWETIVGGVANSGSYSWTPGSLVDSNMCIIKIVPTVPDPNVICVESGLFIVHADSPGVAVTPRWRSLGGDFTRRGRSDLSGPEYGCVKWEYEVGDAISASMTVGPNDGIYVPCEDGKLYKLDANGSLLWSFDGNSPLISSATLGLDGTAYVGSRGGQVFAVDIDGNVRWTFRTGGEVYSSPAVSADGNSVYVCSGDGKVYALGRDGSFLWDFSTSGINSAEGAVFASPSIGLDGTVYVGGFYDSNLYALEPNDGSIKWTCHFDSKGWLFASAVVGDDGTIYQSMLYDSYLYAIDPNDGEIVWATDLSEIWSNYGGYVESYSDWFEPYYDEGFYFVNSRCGYEDICVNFHQNALYNVSDSVWSEPVVGSDGMLYVSFDDPWLRAVDPNGEIKKIMQVGVESGFDLTLGSDGLIYGVSNDSNMYLASPNLIEISRYDSNNLWLSYPVIVGGNTLLVGDSRDYSLEIGTSNSRVIALGPDGCGGEYDLHWQGGAQDLNGDGLVNYNDIAMLASDWLRCTSCADPVRFGCNGEPIYQQWLEGDVNRDRYVNWIDFAIIADKWMGGTE